MQYASIALSSALLLCCSTYFGDTLRLSKKRTLAPGSQSLREWLSESECLSIAIGPLANSYHNLFGVFRTLRDHGLLKKVTGLTGTSASATVAAYLAAGNDGSRFVEEFPGFVNMGNTNDNLVKSWTTLLTQDLPAHFEDLKIPAAITVTLWSSVENASAAAQGLGQSRVGAHAWTKTAGDLIPTVIAANALIVGDGCPDCKSGWKAQTLDGKYPVSDGGYADPNGTVGLAHLPHCDRLLHVWQLAFENQVARPSPRDMPGAPKEVVTLETYQPETVSMAAWRPWNSGWFSNMYTIAREATTRILDKPMSLVGADHFVIQSSEALDLIREKENWFEKWFDEKMALERSKAWNVTGRDSDSMSQDG